MQHLFAVTRHLGFVGPLVGPVEAPFGDDRGVVGFALAAGQDGFVQIRLGVLVDVGGYIDRRFRRHIAERIPVDAQFQLVIERLGEKAAQLVVGLADQGQRHTVVDDEIEPDMLLRVPEFGRQLF